jgi:hypothetical protein
MKRAAWFLVLIFAVSVVAGSPASEQPGPGSGGLVVGKKCPAFSYRTVTGKRVTNKTFRGKAFLIDIWSTT